MANGRCRLHGGATPSGPDSANFKHGKYARVFQGKLAEKFNLTKDDPTPLDLMSELAVQKAVLEQYIEIVSSKKRLKLTELQSLSDLTQDVVKTGTMIAKMHNDAALTATEIKFIQIGMTKLLEKYVPDPDKRRSFIEELRRFLPQRDDAHDAGSEFAIVSVGTEAAS